MDLNMLRKGAIELGVIPMVALFLVFAMHLQNRRLTTMLQKQEQNNMDVVKLLIRGSSREFPVKLKMVTQPFLGI
jgi:hypothetical protein